MQVTVETWNPLEADVDLLVLPLSQLDQEKPRLPGRARAIDTALEGGLCDLVSSGDFTGKAGETLLLYPKGALAAKRMRV